MLALSSKRAKNDGIYFNHNKLNKLSWSNGEASPWLHLGREKLHEEYKAFQLENLTKYGNWISAKIEPLNFFDNSFLAKPKQRQQSLTQFVCVCPPKK